MLVACVPTERSPAESFATVGALEITREDFDREVYLAARQTYYHGRPQNEPELLRFRRSVAEKLIDRALLEQEADRRGLNPDHSAIRSRLAQYEARYSSTEQWQQNAAKFIDVLRRQLEHESLVAVLKSEITAIEAPAEDVLRQYYHDNIDKFTEPARNRVSAILLGVAPGAAPATWQAARLEAQNIVKRLGAGANFAEVARLRSSDPSAADGGDMGYVHAGMLSPAAENAIAAIQPGSITEPVRVLEGIAVFQLTGRVPSTQREYSDVRDRVAELWAREEKERRWQETIARLRITAHIEIDDAYLEALPDR